MIKLTPTRFTSQLSSLDIAQKLARILPKDPLLCGIQSFLPVADTTHLLLLGMFYLNEEHICYSTLRYSNEIIPHIGIEIDK